MKKFTERSILSQAQEVAGQIWTKNDAGLAYYIEQGVDVNLRYGKNSTFLHAAACYGTDGAVKLLIAAGAKVDAVDDEGKTPLALAASQELLHQAYPRTLALIAAGADIYAPLNIGDGKIKVQPSLPHYLRSVAAAPSYEGEDQRALAMLDTVEAAFRAKHSNDVARRKRAFDPARYRL